MWSQSEQRKYKQTYRDIKLERQKPEQTAAARNMKTFLDKRAAFSK